MYQRVTRPAESDRVPRRPGYESPGGEPRDSTGPATLASPSVSPQHLLSEAVVQLGIEARAGVESGMKSPTLEHKHIHTVQLECTVKCDEP